MFGLSFREKIMKMIQNACTNNINVYRNSLEPAYRWMIDSVDETGSLSEEDDKKWEQLLKKADRDYRNAVSNSILEIFRGGNSSICSRFELLMKDPSIIGLDDYDASAGIGAGVLYAMAYTAATDKAFKGSDMVSMNHFQYGLIQDVVNELSAIAEKDIQKKIDSSSSSKHAEDENIQSYSNTSTSTDAMASAYSLAASALIKPVATVFRENSNSTQWEENEDFVYFRDTSCWFTTMIICQFQLSDKGYKQTIIDETNSKILLSAFQEVNAANPEVFSRSYSTFVNYFKEITEIMSSDNPSYYETLALVMYKWSTSPLVTHDIISNEKNISIYTDICISLAHTLEKNFSNQ